MKRKDKYFDYQQVKAYCGRCEEFKPVGRIRRLRPKTYARDSPYIFCCNNCGKALLHNRRYIGDFETLETALNLEYLPAYGKKI